MYRKSILYTAITFAGLCLVSGYKQANLGVVSQEPFRALVVYVMYLLFLGGWIYSVATRFTQSRMRRLLYVEMGMMAFWISVRFVQEAFLYRQISLMRTSGYLIAFPIICIPLIVFFAALGLGKGETYRSDSQWFYLCIPAAGLCVLMLTNECHFLVFRYSIVDQMTDLSFRPNFGIYMIALWAIVLELAKIVCIFRRGYRNKNSSYRRFLPFFVALLLPLYSIPYFVSDFFVTRELMELSAALFFLEAITWESCVAADMIVVNTSYSEVFRNTTMGLQIFDEECKLIAKSEAAQEISKEQLEKLLEEGRIETEKHTELQLHAIHHGKLVWSKDLVQVKKAILKLEQQAEELEQESTLLNEELRTRSEEAKIQIQNEIYDRLTREVGAQLQLMDRLLEGDLDTKELFRRINIVGTYVKRRCNLRLIEQESGKIGVEDLYLSIRDYAGVLEESDIFVEIVWRDANLDSELFLFGFDILEALVEYEEFEARAIRLGFGREDLSICIQNQKMISVLPVEKIEEKNRGKYVTVWKTMQNGYELTISERK